MSWYWITGTNLKGHVVHECLKEKVVSSLTQRGIQNIQAQPITKATIDVGEGVCLVNRSFVTINYDELALSISASGFSDAMYAFIETKTRNEIGVEYVKIHFDLICICLTPVQRAEILVKMQNRDHAAAELANADFEEWRDRHGQGQNHPGGNYLH